MNHELGEAWLAKRLLEHCGVDVFTGTTNRDVRRERIRTAILERGLANVVLGRGADKKPETYSQIFQRLFGQLLIDPKSVQG